MSPAKNWARAVADCSRRLGVFDETIFFRKGRIFSIRKLTVGVASVAVGLAFFASGNVAASELVTEPKLEVDGQGKDTADVDHEKVEAIKEEVTEKQNLTSRKWLRKPKLLKWLVMYSLKKSLIVLILIPQ